jgi:hypothetical protein
MMTNVTPRTIMYFCGILVASGCGPSSSLTDAGSEDAMRDAGATGNGRWDMPIVIGALPAVVRGDTTMSLSSLANSYLPCAPTTPESGHEIVYTLTPAVAGTLTLTLDDVPGDSVDIDVQLLSAARPDACLARDNVTLSAQVMAGVPLWISVDSFFDGSMSLEGPYTLTIDFVPG